MGAKSSVVAGRPVEDEKFITLKALSRRLGIDEKELRRMREAGTIKAVPIGKRGKYLYSQVRAQIESAAQ